MDYISHSPEETEAIGEKLASAVSVGAVIALEGDLGAGKTAFTRGFIRHFGYSGRVTSPTFAIVNEYPTDACTICHFDMYRILDEEALYDIGWDDYLRGDKILVIEWSENIKYALPPNHITVTIRHMDDEDTRKITISKI